MTRIGPQMERACFIVGNQEGCSIKCVAEQISPHPVPSRNWALGYEPVNRAIAAGLIEARRGKRNAYALYLTDKGTALVSKNDGKV
jgi:hypothetical protein